MKKTKHSITFLAGRYIAHLLIEQLPSNLVFHNFHHTVNVVRGVRDITKQLALSKTQKEILLLAAWFHDSGLTKVYKGHEKESQNLARTFLQTANYPEEKLLQVLACIAATKMPQAPKNLLEEVICDADLYHLSLLEYCHLQALLRAEWQQTLGKRYTDSEWMKENIHFLTKHEYWTTYGKVVLQNGKELNIERYKRLFEDSELKTNNK